MKRFANYVSYSGNREQLDQFANALIKAGVLPDVDQSFRFWSKGKTHILTSESGWFGYFTHKGIGKPMIFTADQFDDALKAAIEPAQ